MSISLKQSISLSKKKFFRAPQWELKLAARIFIGFIVLYFLVVFLALGIGLFFIIREASPDQDPISVVNLWIIYFFGIDFLMRYFIQNPPITDVKSLLLQPITKAQIIQRVMLRSLTSFFNFIPLIILIPFCVVVSVENGSTLSLWIWFFAILTLSVTSNYLIFLINKNKSIAIGTLIFLILGYLLETYFKIPVISFFSSGFEAIYTQPLWILVPLALFAFIWQLTQRFLKSQLYLDKGLGKKKERIIGSKLKFFDAWGTIGVLLKNDIRLIIRNIRARQVVLMGFMFLFYGLFFFTQQIYIERPVVLIFAGVFITGGFMTAYGQYVPAWDSEYYSFLMGQNLPYKEYLKSKLYLLMFSIVLCTFLSFPYLYFGKKVMLIILAAGLFNLGLGSLINLFSGAYNATPIKLNVKAKAFENTQAFNLTQLLFSLPKLVLPIIIFYLPYAFLGFNAGILGLVFSGILGLVFQNKILNWIERIYQTKKYETLASFNKSKI